MLDVSCIKPLTKSIIGYGTYLSGLQSVAYLGGPLGDAPPLAWTQNFFEHIEPKKLKKIFSGGGTAPSPDPFFSGEGTPHPHTPPHCASGASNLASLALAPPSQNPKYATGCNRLVVQTVYYLLIFSLYFVWRILASKSPVRYNLEEFVCLYVCCCVPGYTVQCSQLMQEANYLTDWNVRLRTRQHTLSPVFANH